MRLRGVSVKTSVIVSVPFVAVWWDICLLLVRVFDMASLERLAGEGPKKKRKRVSAKFRRLTKERRQANARERDRANALRAAFMSLESSLPQVLKEQLPTRFGTMLAAILYIGHLSELVCDGESPSLEVANRVVCRRYQGLAGEEEIEDGDDVQNTGDDGQQGKSASNS